MKQQLVPEHLFSPPPKSPMPDNSSLSGLPALFRGLTLLYYSCHFYGILERKRLTHKLR
jgi:hypothetical protein